MKAAIKRHDSNPIGDQDRRPARPTLRLFFLAPFAVVVLILWARNRAEGSAHVIAHLALLGAGFFAAGCAVRAGMAATTRARRGWFALAAGVLTWSAGSVLLAVGETRPPDPAGSAFAANVALLALPAGASVAALRLSSPTSIQARIRLILDALIIATSLSVLAWAAVVEDRFIRASPSPSTAVALLYIAAQFLMVGIAVLVWVGTWPARRLGVSLFVSSVVLMTVADISQVYLHGLGTHTGHLLVEGGRLIALCLLGLAALASVYDGPLESPPFQIPTRARLWLPYIPLPPAIAVLLIQVVSDIGPAMVITASVLVLAVFSRQFVVLVENHRLLSAVGDLAFRDQLTGLANRAMFLERLEHAVARQRREAAPLAVLCLDLDNFKTINDQMGHPAGDELLIRVAGRLSACLRSADTVARLGGDEFAVLIESSVEDSAAAADRIMDSFTAPIVVDGVALSVRPSIGLTLATGKVQTSADDLIRHADLAMYAAKRSGGGCVRSFVPELANPYQLPRRSDSAAAAVASNPVIDRDPNIEPREHDSSEARRRVPLAIVIAFGAVFVGEVCFAISALVRQPGRIPLWDSWFETALLLSAALLVAARGWLIKAERSAWLFIAAGMTATSVATVVYAHVPEGQMPSPADPVFLAFYPLVYTGLLLLLRQRLRHVPVVLRLDALVMALAVSSVAAAVALSQIGTETSGSPAKVFVALAYPAAGSLLLGVVVGSLAVLGWRAERRWTVLLAGFVVWVAVDVVYLNQTAHGTYLEGTLLDAGWPAAFLLLAAASWLPSTPVSHTPANRDSMAPPLVSTTAALAVTVLAQDNRLAVGLAALALAAVATRYAVTFRNMTALAESHQQAMTDELTGLANRRAIATALTAIRLDDTAPTMPDRSRKVGLLLLSLDQFGEIRESLGGAVADDLMRRIAGRLSRALGPRDLLARTGEDEFAVLLAEVVDPTTARAQAGGLREVLREPFALAHITVEVDASIAIALWPDHCTRPQELLDRAGAATAHAGRLAGRIAVYDATADSDISHDGVLIDELRTALVERQLTCHYQPKIVAQSERVHSVEALVRWHHPTRGTLLPDQFLPLAEEAGMMRPVATQVLDIALGQVRAWCDKDIDLTVAVNLSATNLLDLGLVDAIDRLLRAHRLPAGALILELTESVLTTNSYRARNTVAALRRLGIRFSLDDYGTGWSSLARLQDLSVDELKLDKVFVSGLGRDPRSIAIVRSTVALAHSLGAELVAEGVEDEATLTALRQYGCNITQGHVHCAPLPADQLEAWLLARKDPSVRALDTKPQRDSGREREPSRHEQASGAHVGALQSNLHRRDPQAPGNPATLDQLPARALLERLPVPSVALARDGHVLFANMAFARLVGRSRDAIHAMHFSELFHPTHDGSPASPVRRYADRLVGLLHADGSVIRARMIKSAPLRDDDPVTLATFEDLTDGQGTTAR